MNKPVNPNGLRLERLHQSVRALMAELPDLAPEVREALKDAEQLAFSSTDRGFRITYTTAGVEGQHELKMRPQKKARGTPTSKPGQTAQEIHEQRSREIFAEVTRLEGYFANRFVTQDRKLAWRDAVQAFKRNWDNEAFFSKVIATYDGGMMDLDKARETIFTALLNSGVFGASATLSRLHPFMRMFEDMTSMEARKFVIFLTAFNTGCLPGLGDDEPSEDAGIERARALWRALVTGEYKAQAASARGDRLITADALFVGHLRDMLFRVPRYGIDAGILLDRFGQILKNAAAVGRLCAMKSAETATLTAQVIDTQLRNRGVEGFSSRWEVWVNSSSESNFLLNEAKQFAVLLFARSFLLGLLPGQEPWNPELTELTKEDRALRAVWSELFKNALEQPAAAVA